MRNEAIGVTPYGKRKRAGVVVGCGHAACTACYQDAPDVPPASRSESDAVTAFAEWLEWLPGRVWSPHAQDLDERGVPSYMLQSGYLGGRTFAHVEVLRVRRNNEGEQVYAGEEGGMAEKLDAIQTVQGCACETIELAGHDYVFAITPGGD